jgi:hypothetical protein
MKQISNHVPPLGESGLQISSPRPSLPAIPVRKAPSSLMVRLWERMVEMYGERWTRNYGDTPLDSWAEELAPFGPRQFRAAVNACLKKYNPQSVPSLPEFVQFCMAALPKSELKSLPKPVPTPDQVERGRQALSKIKRSLRGVAA